MIHQYPENEYYGVSRPEQNILPPIALPVYPRSTGIGRRCGDWEEDVPAGRKNFVEIFWSVTGEGRMILENRSYLIRPGYFFYRLPLQPHHFQSLSSEWTYHWLTFDGENAEAFMQSYRYSPEPFAAGECPTEYFQNFRNHLYLRTPYSWRMMFAEICRILAVAGGTMTENTADSRLLNKALDICRMRFCDPELNVNSLAEKLGIGRTTLNHLFQRRMNLSPITYLSQIRFQEALSLLESTRLPLRAIATRCGFSDVNYFCRFIKKHSGRRPGELH